MGSKRACLNRDYQERKLARRRWAGLLDSILLLGLWAGLLGGCLSGPRGPLEPAWDRQACVHCGMLLGDPSFAAEIQCRDGRILFFDDPGCLLSYQAKKHPDALRVYFHQGGGAGWLAEEEAAFEPRPGSPMGYGFAAVTKKPGTQAKGMEWARQRVMRVEKAGRLP